MILNTQTSLGWHTHIWQAHKFWRHDLISLCCSHTQTLISPSLARACYVRY